MLTGDNGLINQTINANKQTDIAGTREQIELELMARYDTEGNYTNNDVIEAVKIVIGQEVEEGTATITTAKGNEVDISDLWREIPPSPWTADYATLTVTNGKQTLNIGDTIDYDPLAGVTDTSLLEYTSPTGTYVSDTYAAASTSLEQGSGYSTAQTFSANSYTGKWRLLGVDDSGQLLVMSNTNIGTYYLGGQTGATYGMEELDNISSIFGHGTGATGARSITVEDINKITGYNPNNEGVKDLHQSGSGTPCSSGWFWEYGSTATYRWGYYDSGRISASSTAEGNPNYANQPYYKNYYTKYGFNCHSGDFNWVSIHRGSKNGNYNGNLYGVLLLSGNVNNIKKYQCYYWVN